jgi:hypothetical protein
MIARKTFGSLNRSGARDLSVRRVADDEGIENPDAYPMTGTHTTRASLAPKASCRSGWAALPVGPFAGLVEVQEPESSCGGRRRRIAVKRFTIIDPIAKRKAVTKVTLIKYSIRLPPRAKANPTLCKSGGLPEGGCTHLGDVRLRSDLFRCMRSSRNAERGL